jgi:hypothetical protein
VRECKNDMTLSKKTVGIALLEAAGIALVAWYVLTYQLDTLTALAAKLL